MHVCVREETECVRVSENTYHRQSVCEHTYIQAERVSERTHRQTVYIVTQAFVDDRKI